MNEVAIGRGAALIFRTDEVHEGASPITDHLMVTAELQGLRASKDVYDFDGWAAFLAYFEELAHHWRGWKGDKTFDSLEGDLRLSAKHEGHILLTFELKQLDGPPTWIAKGEISLEPGEELILGVEALRGLPATRMP